MTAPPADLTYILLHGFGTSGGIWQRVAGALGRGRALCPDLPGFGAAAGHSGTTVAQMADHVQAGIRAASPGSFVLVGHSMGAKVAVELAARAPLGLAGLALVAPSPPGGEPMTAQARADLSAAWNNPQRLEALYRQITRRPLAEAELQALVRDGQRASRAAWIAWPESGSREDLTLRARVVGVPTLVVASRNDPAITLGTVQQDVLPLLHGAALETLSGVGHLAPLEAPQEVSSALLRWGRGLAGLPG